MSKGKAMFQAMCDAPDLERAVSDIPPKHWARLYDYLVAVLSENGVTGEVLSLMLIEGNRRYIAGLRKKATEAFGENS